MTDNQPPTHTSPHSTGNERGGFNETRQELLMAQQGCDNAQYFLQKTNTRENLNVAYSFASAAEKHLHQALAIMRAFKETQ